MTSEQHIEQLENLPQENKEYHTSFQGHPLMHSFLTHHPSLLAEYSKINEEQKKERNKENELRERNQEIKQSRRQCCK